LCRFPAGVAPHFVEKGSDPDFLSADVRDDAVELVEAMIADHEAAAALAVLDGDGCTEPLRKLHLESAHVRVLRASARVVAGRPSLGPAGEPADRVLRVANTPSLLADPVRELDLHGLRRNAEERAGMAHVELAALEHRADRLGQLEEPEQ